MTVKYEYICRNEEIPRLLAEAEKHKYIALDTENSGGLDVLNPDVRLLLLQLNIGGTLYVIDARKVDLSLLRDLLEGDSCIKIVQNVNYDYKALKVLRGISLRNVFDTMIAESLLEAGLLMSGFSLGDLTKKYLNIQMNKEVVTTFSEHRYDAPFTDEQLEYAALDVSVLPEIRRKQQQLLDQHNLNAISELEFSLIEPVAEMELAGFRLDVELWRKSLAQTNKRLFQLVNELRQVLPDPPAPPVKEPRIKKDGTPFANNKEPAPPPILNLDSWQQVVEAFRQIGVDLDAANRKTRKGPTNSTTLKFAQAMYSENSTGVSALKSLIRYRGLNQVKKTFGENLIDHVKEDGRIHARFWQTGADSGRFRSSDPNLQNIQKKGEEGKVLRSCFIPADGHKLIIADYSQIELRIVAELSGDKTMLDILSDPNGDIHRGTASLMYNIPYNEVSGTLRSAAKALNFGIIYGMYKKTLSERLDCSIEAAATHMKVYRETYPTLMDWLEAEGKKAFDRGWARTMGSQYPVDGRIRWFPTLNRKDFETHREYESRVEFFKRVGRNHPVQGTSADMIKLAIISLYRPLLELQSKIVNTIHDEVCIEAPFEHAIEAAKLTKKMMVIAGKKFIHSVPVLVEIKIRDCWDKDDIDAAKLGIQDDEEGQQLWLLPRIFEFDD